MTANTFGNARCTVGVVVHEICRIPSENSGPQLLNFSVSVYMMPELLVIIIILQENSI